ncbi:SMI1/KNR4 family protein [Streptomyces sp. NPDC051956]|uniref:SMI1/KNR4 family protein n=1 Tax=Streptomyces sp. NPDC051956 TaxID=3365677 RepID=UPI0037CF0E6F
MNRLLGYAMGWVALMGAITFGAGEDLSDRLAALVATLPAWGYIGFRIRRKVRAIKEDSRLARGERRRLEAVMEPDELVDAVTRLVGKGARRFECCEDGHGSGHVCLALSEELDLLELVDGISNRYGASRNLAMRGYADPTVDATTGLPVLTPFGTDVIDMRAWAHADQWIGAGTVRVGDDIRHVVLVAERAAPVVAGLPADATWVERVVAVTGWVGEARTVDWDAVEARLGTRLPTDFKQLAQIFGYGAFDGFLTLYVPETDVPGMDFVEHAEYLARFAARSGTSLWEPYGIHPAPGGLLEWGSSEQADQFYWLTEGDDPDRWPVLASQDIPDTWTRFDGTAAEFVFRMLTERSHPHSMARYYDTHWFQSYEEE